MAERKSILERVMETPDDQMRDDDHLERKGLTDEQAAQGFAELVEKFKDQPVIHPKSNEFAQGIIDVLNDPSIAD